MSADIPGCAKCGGECIYCSGEAKTREDVEKFTEDLEDFLGEANAANIEGRLLKWLGLEE